MENTLYFAYGSNINLEQMVYRCPDASVVGPVVLEGWELLFRSNSRGNGVATIAPCEGGRVHGLLWRITPECEQSLDIYEGYPNLYDKTEVTVRDRTGQEFVVMAYEMTNLWREPSVPSIYYYQVILEGYRQNGLPTAALKRAWEHSVKEVHGMTVRINEQACRHPKKRNGHDR